MAPSEIQALLDFIAKSGLDEVKIETEELKLRVKKSTSPKIHQNIIQAPAAAMPHDSTGLVASTPAFAPQSAVDSKKDNGADDSSGPSTEKEKNNYIPIQSPMIGTFYQSPNPESGPFVKVGDRVTPGKTVCVIEAMKLFNEIESEVSGTVVEVLVEDASPVEFDQPLFLIDPS